jgi:hypothetical protein
MGKKSGKKKKAKASATAAPKQSTQQPAVQQSPLSVLIRCLRWCWHWIWRLLAGAIFLAGLAATIAALWGPIWPTAPVFLPGLPSSGEPFDIPFTVKNNSVLFPIKNLTLRCHVVFARTDRNNRDIDSTFAVNDRTLLDTNESRPFICPLTRVLGNFGLMIEGRIYFSAEYESPWPFSDGKYMDSEVFTLNSKSIPPRWDIGTPIE